MLGVISVVHSEGEKYDRHDKSGTRSYISMFVCSLRAGPLFGTGSLKHGLLEA